MAPRLYLAVGMAYKYDTWNVKSGEINIPNNQAAAALVDSGLVFDDQEIASMLIKYSLVRDDNVADRVETGYMFIVTSSFTGAQSADVAISPALQTTETPGVTFTMNQSGHTVSLYATTTNLASGTAATFQYSVQMEQRRD